jgi:beta-fructofuranosidase
VTERIARPTYHFAPKQGWLNDPLAVTFREGRVDLFYQCVPEATSWRAGCHWGHASSDDLVTWDEHPPALSPGDGDGGCWSGCIVAEADLLLYTSVNAPDLSVGRVRVARPVDRTWQRWAKGSFVADLPDGVAAGAFRDPFVWWDDDRWRMLVGAALPGGTAAALTFTSTDLVTWSYDGVFAQRHTDDRDGAWSGSLWECPQLVSVDGADYLIVSVWDDEVLHYVAAARGNSRDGRFEAASWQQLTIGSYYAATAFRDDAGHAGLMHWLRGVGDPEQGWMGALSVPHRLSVDHGLLVARPHPRVASARRRVVADHQPLTAGDVIPLSSWHCEVVVDPGQGAGRLQLHWWGGAEASARLTLTTDPGLRRWTVSAGDGTCSAPLLGESEQLTVLLDGWLAEAFLGRSGVAALPVTTASSTAPELVVSGSPGSGGRLTVWELVGADG